MYDDDNDDVRWHSQKVRHTPKPNQYLLDIPSLDMTRFKVEFASLPSTKPSDPRINIAPFSKGGVPLKHYLPVN